MKKALVSIMALSLIACDNSKVIDSNGLKNNHEVNPTNDIETINNSSFPTNSKAEISYYDSLNKRYFLVVDSSIIFEFKIIEQIICYLKENHETTVNTSISFFSEHKWANYKDILFIDTPVKFPIEEYPNWLNFHYQGEFDFKNREYQTYPVSDPKLNKRKNFKIKKC